MSSFRKTRLISPEPLALSDVTDFAFGVMDRLYPTAEMISTFVPADATFLGRHLRPGLTLGGAPRGGVITEPLQYKPS